MVLTCQAQWVTGLETPRVAPQAYEAREVAGLGPWSKA